MKRVSRVEVWKDDEFRACVVYSLKQDKHSHFPPIAHIVVSRLDNGKIVNWNDLMDIKNRVVGSEFEAVQIFPAEKDVVDNANNYHLWVFLNPEFKLPFGLGRNGDEDLIK